MYLLFMGCCDSSEERFPAQIEEVALEKQKQPEKEVKRKQPADGIRIDKEGADNPANPEK